MIYVKSKIRSVLVPTPQPKIGQNETGTFEKSYPTPADDVALTAQLASNSEDYVQTLYGTPPPENTNPDFLLVNEVPIDWMLVKRKYVQDRSNEGTYNASISYSGESKDHPIFTRDYLVRRANYVPLTKLSSLAGLINAAVTAKGSGYTVASVILTGGTGSGGAVAAIISNGKIVHLAIASEGNYTVAPALSIVGDGLGATGSVSVQPATALLVKEDYLRQQDSDLDGLYVLVRRIYETLPGPILSGSTTDPQSKITWVWTKQLVASGSVSGGITGAGITTLSILNGGTGFTAGTYNLLFSGGGGVGAAGTYTVTGPAVAGSIGAIALTAVGVGFTSIPAAAVSGGGGSGATIAVVLAGKPIASLTLATTNSLFNDVPTLAIADNAGTGSGATGTCVLTATGVASVAVNNGGSGFGSATITFAAPDTAGGTTATGTVNLSGGVITSISMTNNGSGYTKRPAYTFSGDGTGQSLGPAVLQPTSVAFTTLTATGNLYQNPSVTISGGSGTATATAIIQPTSIQSITLTGSGSGYSAPVIAFSGGGGSGATATATLATGTITSAALTNPGVNYTSAPAITTPSGGGVGASITAHIGSLTFVDVEPLTAVKDMVMRSTVDLSTLPPPITVPVSVRVVRTDKQTTSLQILTVYNSDPSLGFYFDTDVGFLVFGEKGGNGPALGYLTELWLTDSQYAGFNPGPFSSSGKSTTSTSYYEAVNGPAGRFTPRVWTFVPQNVSQGTTAGVYDISAERWRLGIWHVRVITIPTNY